MGGPPTGVNRRSGPSGDSRTEPASFDLLLKRVARLAPLPASGAGRLRSGDELCGGRFRVERVVGEGGMGVVYEALDGEIRRAVALKTLTRVDADGIYRLKNEFRSLADVVHPNLVRLHELFLDGARWFFSMELVPGLPFDEWVRPERVLDEARLRGALRQLVAGARAIHTAGKLHCDLKPSNVLVTADGRLVILDLGLVADPAGGIGRTLDDRALGGTPAYMAPEQLADGALGPASDWYAVGVMLFEALTGRLPFEGSAASVLAQKQIEDAPAPGAVGDGVAPDLEALCSALLARDPARRPTGEAIVSILGGLSADSDTSRPRTQGGVALVGRESELAVLRDAHAVTRTGKPTVMWLVGESGVGKSALAAKFLEEVAMAERAVVLGGRCYEAESVPYKAFDRLIDQLTRYLRRLSPVEAAALLPRDVAALARLFPVLDRVESVAQAPAREMKDERQLRDRAFRALGELLARITDRRPLVLFMDDLQWTDFDSTLLLEHLLGDPEGAPVLYLFSHRAVGGHQESDLGRLERTIRAGGRVAVRRLSLGPLSREAAAALARDLLGGVPGADGLARSIADAAEGNPYFVSELARTVPHADATTSRAPISLRDALHARLSRLSPGSRDLLDLVALSGRPVPLDVIERAAAGAGDVRVELTELRLAQLVRPGSERAYECHHDRIRVALVEMIDASASCALHARLARAWSERGDPDPEVLFEHCVGAGMREEAARHALRAADKTDYNLAFERCAAFLGEAIAFLPEEESERLALRERRAGALSMAGRWATAGDAFAEAAARVSGRRRTTYLGYQAALHHLASGRRAEGLPRLQWVLAQVGVRWPRTRLGAWLAVCWHLAWLAMSRARHRLVGTDAPNVFDGFDGRRVTPEAAFPDEGETAGDLVKVEMLLAGAALVPPYDVARGVYFMTAFARRALRLGDRGRVAVALGMLSVLFHALRQTTAFARRLGDEARALARAAGPSPLASAALSFVGFARFGSGAFDEALALGAEAEQGLRALPRTYAYETWTARTVRSFALLLMGRVGEAADLFKATGREARELGDELAALGGESPIHFLVEDDVEGALDLVERKRAALARIGEDGVVHQIVLMDRITCALYQGRGGEALPLFRRATPAMLAAVDAPALPAHCALQAMQGNQPTAGLRRIVKRAVRTLERRRLSATSALAAQLQAALCLLDRDEDAARAQIEIAIERSARAGMTLHEAVLRWHGGRVRGGAEGDAAIAAAERFMRAQGIANPARWAHMLAPGLSRA